jgi:hypothetical protein
MDNWMQMEGFGARISVGPDGAPWIVNAKNEIYRGRTAASTRRPVLRCDIGVVATDAPGSSAPTIGIYRGTATTGIAWKGRVAISVDPFGRPWVVNASNEIYQWERHVSSAQRPCTRYRRGQR